MIYWMKTNGMAREIVSQLKALQESVNPNDAWVKNNRAVLLSQVANSMPVQKSVPKTTQWNGVWSRLSNLLPQPVAFAFRPLAILVIVAVVGTSGVVGTVDAAYDTLPGEPMYVFKRASEQAQVAVASLLGDSAVAKVHAKLAKRRADETKKILANPGNQTSAAVVAATVADLKNELNAVNQKLDDAKNNGGDKTTVGADVAKDVKQHSDQINQVLKDVKDSLLVTGGATSTSQLLAKEIGETKDLAKDVSVNAVEVLVTKHLEGDTSVSKEDVKQTLVNSLDAAASEADESKQTVDGVRSIVDTAKSEVKDLNKDVRAHTESAAVTSSTKAFSDQISSVSNQTIAAVLKTEAAAATVDQKVTEAKQLLNQDDLTKALNKIKEVSQVTKEAEKISDASVQSIQNVLPIVSVVKTDIDGVVSTTTLLDNLIQAQQNAASGQSASGTSATSSSVSTVTSSIISGDKK